jgi:hypothetical protein
MDHKRRFPISNVVTVALAGMTLVLLATAARSQAPAPAPGGRDRYKEGLGANEQVEKLIRSFAGKGEIGDNSLPTPAAEAVTRFRTAEGFEI